MAKLSLNKAALHKETAKLKRYRQYLPSLDLKRQQLIAELAKAQAALRQTQRDIETCRLSVAKNLPMLANRDISLQNLVTVNSVDVASENIVGILVPVLRSIKLTTKPYSLYLKPHWVDRLVIELEGMLTLRMRERIQKQRLDILSNAVKKVTQKVNLFDKVLIPRTQDNIRRIRLFLSDAERTDVVRAKITKQLRLQQTL